MDPDRWQKIDQLFHSALARQADARAAFLTEACTGDDALRLELESLIGSHEQSDSFIEAPASDLAAELLAGRETELPAGQAIGPYKIVSRLGAGGMGEVYLTDDTRLGRKVALKLLPPKFTVDVDRVRRFGQEARAASALNHPNIVTIHEIGQTDSLHFIATEFVDGETLRAHMTGTRMTVIDVLDVAVQIASALQAAHEAGIVHRDIKPENIMLRRDRIVKVVDFGLAKLASQEPRREAESSISSMANTNPGVVLGTVRYMSPEQARGFPVDARTDTWSLGIVLYEMITGRVPFEGATSSHVIVAILEDELPPLSGYVQVPPELERIVTRALRKNRDLRYPKASDLALDLKSLKQGLEGAGHLHWTLQPGARTDVTAGAGLGPALLASGHASASTVPLHPPQPTSRAAYLGGQVRGHKKAAILALTLFLVAAGIAFGVYRSVGRRTIPADDHAKPFQTIELVRLSATGRVRDAAISLDGKHLAYVAESEGKESIWLRDVATSHNSEIVPPAEVEHFGETFSPDGTYVYYLTKERNNTIAALNRVPMVGGPPVKLILDVDGPITFSPDGKQLAFVRGSSKGERALMLANLDGSEERKLATRTGYHAFSFGGPAWSPDGKSIASGAAITDPNMRSWSVVTVDVGDGSIRELTNQRWKSIGRIVWLKDGDGMVFSATGLERSSTSQLWYLSYPDAEVQRITRDLQDYHGVSLTSDSRTLVSKQGQTHSSLWLAPNGDADRASKILSHKEDDAYSYFYRTRFSWTPQGQIIYSAIVNGTPSIWMMSREGTGNRQLSRNPGDNSFPSMTADGRHIIFVSERAGFPNVWRVDSDGSNEMQLTTGEDETWAWSSPDSRWIVYHSGKLGQRTLWRVPMEGGKQEQLTEYPSIGPVVSPDGKWISCYYRPETKAPWKLAIIPFDGGPPVKTFEIPQNVIFQSLVRWTPDGSSLAYIMNRDGISNIWIQPLDGKPAEQLTHFKTDQIFWFDWSPDARQLGVSRGAVTSDVVLIKDIR